MPALAMVVVMALTAVAANAQFTAELRHAGPTVEDGVELHVHPRPALVTVALASHAKPELATTGSVEVDVIDSWAEKEAYGYEGRQWVIKEPHYSHIGTAYGTEGMLAIGAVGYDGMYQQWTWLPVDGSVEPAWDAELRAQIATISAAITALQEESQALQNEVNTLYGAVAQAESDRDHAVEMRDAAITARDEAIAEVQPLRDEVEALQMQRSALMADIEEAKEALAAIIASLPPGLRNR